MFHAYKFVALKVISKQKKTIALIELSCSQLGFANYFKEIDGKVRASCLFISGQTQAKSSEKRLAPLYPDATSVRFLFLFSTATFCILIGDL